MYILIDHIGRTVHPLGEKPLEAIIEFCRYVRECKSPPYPPGCDEVAFDAFRLNVADGTTAELFDVANMTTECLKQAGKPRHIFEVAILPRPACRECMHWKNDGAFCEHGKQEQALTEPGCYEWRIPHTEWKDIRQKRPGELYRQKETEPQV